MSKLIYGGHGIIEDLFNFLFFYKIFSLDTGIPVNSTPSPRRDPKQISK